MPSLIARVKREISIPLIVGGGIDSVFKARALIREKPDYIVIGNALEKNPFFINELNILF